MDRTPQERYRANYAIHMMACTAASLALLLIAVRYWPTAQQQDPSLLTYRAPAPEIIAMEEVQPTLQRRKPPPPPAPLPPVIMPEDRILEDPELLDADYLPVDDAGPPDLASDAQTAPNSAPEADTGPKPVRIAEPEYPRAAQRRNVRAEVVVRVKVDARGRVTSPEIYHRYLLSENGTLREPVDKLGFGLEEAAISAATRWLFRPARKQGRPVSSEYELSIKFGV